MKQIFDTGSFASRHIFSIASASQKSRIGPWVFYAVMGFMFLHILNWSAKCGPFSSGKYRDYCTDLEQTRAVKANVVANDVTYAWSKAQKKSPYVDLQDSGEVIEEFLPEGYGRSTLRANVRSDPNMESEVLITLDKDQIVEILETQGSWLKIRYGNPTNDDEVGWVWKDLLKH